MADVESTAPVEARPPWGATVPGFPFIDVIARSDGDEMPSLVQLTYYGWPNNLVDAGLLPPEAFVMGPRRRRGARVDQDGTRWLVTSYWRLKDNGRRGRFFRIGCSKPLPVARRLPGANEALEVEANYQRWEHQRDQERQRREARLGAVLNQVDPSEPFLKALRRLERPALRLVVDNTRK